MRGEETGKFQKAVAYFCITRKMTSRLDTTIKHSRDIERKKEGAYDNNDGGGDRNGAKAVAYYCE